MFKKVELKWYQISWDTELLLRGIALRTWLFISKPYWKLRHYFYIPKTTADYYTKLDFYLKSIGGAVNGYFGKRRPPILGYFFRCESGWGKIVYDLTKDLVENGWNKQICQVKEKYGSLRFYLNAATKENHVRVSKAENLSYKTCQECGADAEMCTSGYWMITLCDKCLNDLNERSGYLKYHKSSTLKKVFDECTEPDDSELCETCTKFCENKL